MKFDNILSQHLSMGLLLLLAISFPLNGVTSVIGIGPPRFVENKGQVRDQNSMLRPDVLFYAATQEYSFLIRSEGFSFQLFTDCKDHLCQETRPSEETSPSVPYSSPTTYLINRIDANWVGSNSDAVVVGTDTTGGFENYYFPHCPDGIHMVYGFKNVSINNLYNGIDVLFYLQEGTLKSDYLVHSGVDYKQIKFTINGADPFIDKHGNLVYKTKSGQYVMEEKPYVLQKGKKLNANWVIENDEVSFSIYGANNNEPILIDPAYKVWGTFYGGSGGELGSCVKTDSEGSVYFSGTTSSVGTGIIATSGAYQETFAGSTDGMLVKFNGDGTRQWGTYFGGFDLESISSFCIDFSGNIFCLGQTSSTLPSGAISTTGCHQSSYGGGVSDSFIVKFNQTGMRIWGTYFGGSGEERPQGCDTDTSGNLIFCGLTFSANAISTPGSHQEIKNGGSDAFLTKFDSSGVLIWSTYYGGNSSDWPYSCTVDHLGNIYLAGGTSSNSAGSISTPGSHQENINSISEQDGFIAKFSPEGSRIWGTYYGGPHGDQINCIRVNNEGDLIIAGFAGSSSGDEIATPGSHQDTAGYPLGGDAFLAKFDTSGIRYWATYYGGHYNEDALACDFDKEGNIYIAGFADELSGDPLYTISTIDGFQPQHGGDRDGFIAMFNSNGLRQWGSYWGDVGYDEAISCATDTMGHVYLLGNFGWASPGVVSTPGSYQEDYAGSIDAGLIKLNSESGVADLTKYIPHEQQLLYPNPNTGSFLFNNVSNYKNYQIVDMTGKVCSSGVLCEGNNFIENKLNPGNYIFFIYNTEKELSVPFVVR